MRNLFVSTALIGALIAGPAVAQVPSNPPGASIATPVSVPNGGSGNSSLAVGALNTGNGTGAYVPLADVATGSCLTSGGVGIMPGWGSCSSGGGGVPANLTLANPASPITETFPTSSFTAARTDASQTFTGSQTFSSGNFTTSVYVSSYVAIFATKPSVSSGGGAGSTTVSVTGVSTFAGSFVVTASPTSGTFTITFGASADHGWNCSLQDQTTVSNVIGTVAGGTSTTAVFQSYSRTTGNAQAMTAGDVVTYLCGAY
jgi:hypothetical protein